MCYLVTTSRLAVLTVLFTLPALTIAQTPGEHDTGDVQSAAYDDGSWGRDAGFGGTGFVLNAEQGLFTGNLLIGQSSTQVSGQAYAKPQEFATLAAISSVTPPYADFDQGFESEYDDSPEDPIGVSVLQRSYSSSTAGNTTFVIYEYEITNNSGGDLTGIYVGIFSDWDVGHVNDNSGCYDAGSQLLYIWSLTANTSYFGVSVRNGTVSGWNPDDGAGVAINDASSWGSMTTAGACTVPGAETVTRVTIGQGPYDIADGASITAEFCMVGGTDEADIIANAAICNAIAVAIEPGR